MQRLRKYAKVAPIVSLLPILSPVQTVPSSSQNLVCSHAGSAAPDRSTSSPVPSQIQLILRCPVQPRAAHSDRENSGIEKQLLNEQNSLYCLKYQSYLIYTTQISLSISRFNDSPEEL